VIDAYRAFLERNVTLAALAGFEIEPSEVKAVVLEFSCLPVDGCGSQRLWPGQIVAAGRLRNPRRSRGPTTLFALEQRISFVPGGHGASARRALHRGRARGAGAFLRHAGGPVPAH
jgi:hypothetical protein